MWRVKKLSVFLVVALLLTACGDKQTGKREVFLYEEEASGRDAASGGAVSGAAVSGGAVTGDFGQAGTDQDGYETTTVRKATYKEEFSDVGELEYTDTEIIYIDDEDAILDAIKVKQDQEVKKGDVLAIYHIETSKTKLAKQKLLVDQSRAGYEAGLGQLRQNLSKAESELRALSSNAEKKMKQLEIKKMRKEIDAYKKGEKEVIDQEKEYQSLVRKQKKTPLVAKKSGTVTKIGREFIGQTLESTSKIVEMRRSDKWMIRVKDPESKLRYNMDVSVRLGKSVRDYQYEVKGKVITAGDITGVEETDEDGNNIVYIDISEADRKKYDFEKNNIYIQAVSFAVKDALIVDAEAVYSESVDISNKLYVLLVENGKLHKRFIVSNYKSEKEVLVEQGVSVGQTLAILEQ